MNLKKLSLMLFTCASLVSFSACGNNDNTSEQQTESEQGEWWNVSNKGMDEAETTFSEASVSENSETTTEESSEDMTEDAAAETESGETSNVGTGGNTSGNGTPSGTANGNGETAEKEQYEDEQAPSEVYTPDIEIFGEKNVADSIPLSTIKVNGNVLDIKEETVDSFINTAGLRQNKGYSLSNYFETDDTYDGIFWYGKGYGIYNNTQDESKRFTGTHIFIEGIESGFVATKVDPTVENGYQIRSVYASTDTTESDFTVEFVGGVKAGMTRSEIEALFQSTGDTTKTYTYYANKDAALLIFYDENDTAMEIYLFADYDFMPILYSEKEEPVVEEMTEESTEAAVEVISPESAMQVGR